MLLSKRQFTNETASGWQQVDFAPVTITADTVYVASYHTPLGRYSINTNYFAGAAGVNNGALAARLGEHAKPGGQTASIAYGASSVSSLIRLGTPQTTGWMSYSSLDPPPTLNSIAVTPAKRQHRAGNHTTVHCDGDLFGLKHAKHHDPGNLELFDPGSSNDQHKRARDGAFRRRCEHFGNDVPGDPRKCQSYGDVPLSHNHDALHSPRWDCRFHVLGNTRR